MGLFDELDRTTGEDRKGKSKDSVILKAPFFWPGGKSRSIEKLLQYIPDTSRYCEVFGGSGALLLTRDQCKLEVFNDAYSGVTDFYRTLRNPKLFDDLVNRLELTIHSRESWTECKQTWDRVDDPVERAARWYEMVMYSFGALSRNFGRATSPAARLAGKIREKLELFPKVHRRLHGVQIENQDFEDLMIDYDHQDMVFYCDPDYPDATRGIYKHQMSVDDHLRLLNLIPKLKGFVAVSSYPNGLYDAQSYWDKCYTWKVAVSIKSVAYTEGNHKLDMKGLENRDSTTEALYVRYGK